MFLMMITSSFYVLKLSLLLFYVIVLGLEYLIDKVRDKNEPNKIKWLFQIAFGQR